MGDTPDDIDSVARSMRWKTSIPFRHVSRSIKMTEEEEEEDARRRRKIRLHSLSQNLALLRIRNNFDRRLQDLRILSLPGASTRSISKSDTISPRSSLVPCEFGRGLSCVDARIHATRKLLWPGHSPYCWRKDIRSGTLDAHLDNIRCRCGPCAEVDLTLGVDFPLRCCCSARLPRSDFARSCFLGLPRSQMSFLDPEELIEEKRRESTSFSPRERGGKTIRSEDVLQEHSVVHRGFSRRSRDAHLEPSTSSCSEPRRLLSETNGPYASEDSPVQRPPTYVKFTGNSDVGIGQGQLQHGSSLRSVVASSQTIVPSVRKYSFLLQQSLQEARAELDEDLAESEQKEAESSRSATARGPMPWRGVSGKDSAVPRNSNPGYQPVSLAVIKLRALLCKANALSSKHGSVHSLQVAPKLSKPGISSTVHDEHDENEIDTSMTTLGRTAGGVANGEGEKEKNQTDSEQLCEDMNRSKSETQERLAKATSDGSSNLAVTRLSLAAAAPSGLRSSLKSKKAKETFRRDMYVAKSKSVTFASDPENRPTGDTASRSALTSRLSSPRETLVRGKDMDSDFRVALLDLAVRRRIQRQLQDQERGITNFRLPMSPRAPSDPMALLRHSQATHLQRLGTDSTYLQRMRRSEPLSLRTAMLRASVKSKKF